MPKRRFVSGVIDPITIIGVLFLIITLSVGTYVVADKKYNFNIFEKAAILECFPAGTKISLSNGEVKNIEEFEVGDKVISEGKNGKKTTSSTQKLWKLWSFNMCSLDFESGKKLKLTNPHPLYTQDGWKAINVKSALEHNPELTITELKESDSVKKQNGTWDKITSITCEYGLFRVYNLAVDNNNNYFAEGFLAHNKVSSVVDIPGTKTILDDDGKVIRRTKVDEDTGETVDVTNKLPSQVISPEANIQPIAPPVEPVAAPINQPISGGGCYLDEDTTIRVGVVAVYSSGANDYRYCGSSGWTQTCPDGQKCELADVTQGLQPTYLEPQYQEAVGVELAQQEAECNLDNEIWSNNQCLTIEQHTETVDLSKFGEDDATNLVTTFTNQAGNTYTNTQGDITVQNINTLERDEVTGTQRYLDTIIRDRDGNLIDSYRTPLLYQNIKTVQKDDDGFIRDFTTIVRNANTNQILNALTQSIHTKDLAQIAQPTTTIPATIPMYQERGYSSLSECLNDSANFSNQSTCYSSVPNPNYVAPVYSFARCNSDSASASEIAECNQNMSKIYNSPIVGNYIQAYAPQNYQTNYELYGYESVEDCLLNKEFGKDQCYGSQLTKDQATSSIDLGTDIASVIMLPVAPAYFGTKSLLMLGLGTFGGTMTVQQSKNAVIAQIEDPGFFRTKEDINPSGFWETLDPQTYLTDAGYQTTMAGLGWLNLSSADKLMRAWGPAGNAITQQSARIYNTAVSAANLYVDAPYAYNTCTQDEFSLGDCAFAGGVLATDIIFGGLDYYQGQLTLNPIRAVTETIDSIAPSLVNVNRLANNPLNEFNNIPTRSTTEINIPNGFVQDINPLTNKPIIRADIQPEMNFGLADPGLPVRQIDSAAEAARQEFRNSIVVEQDLFSTNPNIFDPTIRIRYQGQEFTANSIREAEEIATQLTGSEFRMTPEMHISEPDALIQRFDDQNNIAQVMLTDATPTRPNVLDNINEGFSNFWQNNVYSWTDGFLPRWTNVGTNPIVDFIFGNPRLIINDLSPSQKLTSELKDRLNKSLPPEIKANFGENKNFPYELQIRGKDNPRNPINRLLAGVRNSSEFNQFEIGPKSAESKYVIVIRDIGTKPEASGQGQGKILLDAIEKSAKEMDIDTIVAEDIFPYNDRYIQSNIASRAPIENSAYGFWIKQGYQPAIDPNLGYTPTFSPENPPHSMIKILPESEISSPTRANPLSPSGVLDGVRNVGRNIKEGLTNFVIGDTIPIPSRNLTTVLSKPGENLKLNEVNFRPGDIVTEDGQGLPIPNKDINGRPVGYVVTNKTTGETSLPIILKDNNKVILPEGNEIDVEFGQMDLLGRFEAFGNDKSPVIYINSNEINIEIAHTPKGILNTVTEIVEYIFTGKNLSNTPTYPIPEISSKTKIVDINNLSTNLKPEITAAIKWANERGITVVSTPELGKTGIEVYGHESPIAGIAYPERNIVAITDNYLKNGDPISLSTFYHEVAGHILGPQLPPTSVANRILNEILAQRAASLMLTKQGIKANPISFTNVYGFIERFKALTGKDPYPIIDAIINTQKIQKNTGLVIIEPRATNAQNNYNFIKDSNNKVFGNNDEIKIIDNKVTSHLVFDKNGNIVNAGPRDNLPPDISNGIDKDDLFGIFIEQDVKTGKYHLIYDDVEMWEKGNLETLRSNLWKLELLLNNEPNWFQRNILSPSGVLDGVRNVGVNIRNGLTEFIEVFDDGLRPIRSGPDIKTIDPKTVRSIKLSPGDYIFFGNQGSKQIYLPNDMKTFVKIGDDPTQPIPKNGLTVPVDDQIIRIYLDNGGGDLIFMEMFNKKTFDSVNTVQIAKVYRDVPPPKVSSFIKDSKPFLVFIGSLIGIPSYLNSKDLIENYIIEKSHIGYFSPTLDTWVYYRDGKWYREDTQQPIPRDIEFVYLKSGLIESDNVTVPILNIAEDLLAKQYVTVQESYFNSPEWMRIKNEVQKNTANNPYDIYLITQSIHENMTYSQIKQKADGAIKNKEILNSIWYGAASTLSTFFSNNQIERILRTDNAICFEYAIVEQSYLASMGISSVLVTADQNNNPTQGHVFIKIVGEDGREWVADPTWGVVMEYEKYITNYNFSDIATIPNNYSFVEFENTPVFNSDR